MFVRHECCSSPLARGALEGVLRRERLEDEVFVGSAGTRSWDFAFRAFLNVPLVSNHSEALNMFEEMFDAHSLPQSSERPDPRARYR